MAYNKAQIEMNRLAKESAKLNKEAAKQTKEVYYQFKKVLNTTVAIASVIGLVKCTSSQDSQTIQEKITQKPITFQQFAQDYMKNDTVKVDIDHMLNDYDRAVTLTEVKVLNDKYSSQYIELTGEVNKIYDDLLEGNYVTLKGYENDHSLTVQCKIQDEEEIKQLQGLEAGDDLTAKGYCLGGQGMSVKLTDCEIEKVK